MGVKPGSELEAVVKGLAAVVVLAVAVFSLWGTGAFVRRKVGAKSWPWPVSITVGVAIMVFIGGVLNVLRVAYAPALWGVTAVGFVLSLQELRRVDLQRIRSQVRRLEFIATAMVITAVIGFTMFTQLPPSAFNVHDDLQKYFTYPVRMLATGTLLGSPLDGLGYQTLGGLSFLQAIVLSVLPIGYINGVDAVFGLLVLMFITASAGWRRSQWFPAALVGPVLIIAINPLSVNVSGLYLGGALMAACVMLVADSREPMPRHRRLS